MYVGGLFCCSGMCLRTQALSVFLFWHPQCVDMSPSRLLEGWCCSKIQHITQWYLKTVREVALFGHLFLLKSSLFQRFSADLCRPLLGLSWPDEYLGFLTSMMIGWLRCEQYKDWNFCLFCFLLFPQHLEWCQVLSKYLLDGCINE